MGVRTFAGATNNIVVLDLITATDTTVTQDARVVIDGNDWRGGIVSIFCDPRSETN
jgi:hypothetical protein